MRSQSLSGWPPALAATRCRRGGAFTPIVQPRVRNLGRLAGRPQFLEIQVAVTHQLVWVAPVSYFNVGASSPSCLPFEQSHNTRNKQDAAWRQFITLLEYKAELYGSHVL